MNADDILRLIPEEMEAGTWLHGYATAVKHLGKDWDTFRREAAKDILCALVIHCSLSSKDGAKIAIEYANELIKQLKDEEK